MYKGYLYLTMRLPAKIFFLNGSFSGGFLVDFFTKQISKTDTFFKVLRDFLKCSDMNEMPLKDTIEPREKREWLGTVEILDIIME